MWNLARVVGRAVARSLFALSLAGAAAAQSFPSYLNYQGKLGDPSGNPLSGTYSFRFKLYAQGSGGSVLFTDAGYTGANAVNVVNGIYSVQIGSLTAGGIPVSAFFNPETWLELDVNAGATLIGAETLTPRERLSASPFAFLASNAQRLGTGVATATFTTDGNLQVTYGVVAGSAALSGGLTASSGTFTASGATQYSVQTTSGISVGGTGGVTAAFFSGSTLALTGTIIGSGATAAASAKVAGLNAEYLNGFASSAFGDATAANQTTILNRIGTSADSASATPSTLFEAEKFIISKVQSGYTASVTMTGIGSAPACPGGWTELVAQTSAGTFQSVTSINTTTINPLTSCTTAGIRDTTATAISQVNNCGGGGQLMGTGGPCLAVGNMYGTANVNTTSSCSSTGYSLVSGVNLTTYTMYYRVCALPR